MSIQVTGIEKSFYERPVLKGIDFLFEKGKINMIIGASGSGKTVLVRCMVGLIKPDKGTIVYEGQNLLTMDHKKTRELRKKIGMLFQGSALFDSMTVAENVGFPLKMFTTMSSKEILNRVTFCLERVNLPKTHDLFPSELSGGMKKRVGIARAIALNPSYLFFDEPNSGLDPKTSAVIDELIKDITDDFGVTSVVVSHDINSVLKIADKILFIYEGNKEWEGTSDQIPGSQNPHLIDFIETSGVIVKKTS